MFNLIINQHGGHLAYGVPNDRWRIGSIGNFMRYFLTFLFFIYIPVMLLVGTFAFVHKKQYSKKRKLWTAVVVLSIYFTVLIGAVMIYVHVLR